jgi:hypothetical protein
MEQQQQNHANGSTRDPLEILRQLKSEVFEDSVQQLALGLGRPEEQVTGWLNGGSEIDEDGVEKINGLATMRLGPGGDSRGPEAAHDPLDSIEQRL